jgi:hypothetical protein
LNENYRPDVGPRPLLLRVRGFTRGRVLLSTDAVKIRPRGRRGADALMRSRGQGCPRGPAPASARTQSTVRADARLRQRERKKK